MILLQEHLTALELHWAVAAVRDSERSRAHDVANARLVTDALGEQLQLSFKEKVTDGPLVERLALAYEVAAAEGLDALLSGSFDGQPLAFQAQAGAFRAFELRRVLPIPRPDLDRIFHILHLAALAYAGDRWADMRRWLFDHPRESAPPNAANTPWDRRLLFRIYDGWLRLFRKDSWNDLHGIAEIVAGLRVEQKTYELEHLGKESGIESQAMALRLLSLYHWARATEQLSKFMLQGDPPDIAQELDLHFEKAIKAASATSDMPMEMLLRWLHVAGRRMVAGSLWSATAGINSRVSKFVQSLTSAARPLIELLPPQRSALAEQGLLNPASRAIVVDLPTSGGKTTLAQFRILQALNQFAEDKGWVAYVAPTRALVAQILRRLRKDFAPLGIKTEQVSGGVEIDTFEEQLLSQEQAFDVLVATPEKLSLIIRNGKVRSRPLALVVVDEAHNIEDEERGLRIELLLATIRQDCPRANYLLLMPFVPHAEHLARWLDPEAGKPISLGSTAWQPNERIVGLYRLVESEERGPRKKKLWSLEFETLTTTPRTIHLKGIHKAGDNCPLNLPIASARSLMNMTVAMGVIFSKRGTSIAVGDTIPHVWGMARTAADKMETPDKLPEEIKLVQSFLRTDVGEDFELVSLLKKRVAVHHAGLPDDARTLVEWLAEDGHLRVLCATTTIAQGINFPVSSVFLSRTEHPSQRGPIPMTNREFWNLAGRAGRVGQDSVGVVGIATTDGEKTNQLRGFVAANTTDLASRLSTLLDDLVTKTPDQQLNTVIHEYQWSDFRSFIAHLLKETKDLVRLQAQTEQLLRSTFGFSMLRSKTDQKSRAKADSLISVTNAYAERLSKNMGAVALADTTGFDPEGVRAAMAGIRNLEDELTASDWEPRSLFGRGQGLADLVGVMMQVPTLNRELDKIKGLGQDRKRIAEIAKAWVLGRTLQEIALKYFEGDDSTAKISEACRAIYRGIVNTGVWGIAALSKMPNSGLNWEDLSDLDRGRMNLIPAYLYHGVDTEDAVLLRMNQVPRSIATSLGERMRHEGGEHHVFTVSEARDFVKNLESDDWQAARPKGSKLSGGQYREVWRILSGESG
jgi:superfamily II DNA/RNA helicase